MRLWHLVFAVLVVAVVLALARDDVGMVAMIVFVTGLGECVLGTTALMALFQTIGAIGESKGWTDGMTALTATTVVLMVSGVVMTGWLFVGVWVLKAFGPSW